MISDVLSEALDKIGDYQKDMAEVYGDPLMAYKIETLKKSMQALLRELDASDDSWKWIYNNDDITVFIQPLLNSAGKINGYSFLVRSLQDQDVNVSVDKFRGGPQAEVTVNLSNDR